VTMQRVHRVAAGPVLELHHLHNAHHSC
jgi:hypothetical protein